MATGSAARLLVEARRRSGLRQAELARRAGVPRSVLNVYERGRRQPGADVLVRILGAAGFDTRLTPAPPIDQERAGRILSQVLGLAEALPSKRRGRLAYPLFRPPEAAP